VVDDVAGIICQTLILGKEIIVRYSTGLDTGGTWATDSNGRVCHVIRLGFRV